MNMSVKRIAIAVSGVRTIDITFTASAMERIRRKGLAAKRSFGMNSETYRTVKAARKLQTIDAAEPSAKSAADIAAVEVEYVTLAKLLPISSIVIVRPMSPIAFWTSAAFRPPSRARCSMRSRLTER